ncbi:Caffeoyl-CoA O-methyltransferase 1, partial [Zea mays]
MMIRRPRSYIIRSSSLSSFNCLPAAVRCRRQLIMHGSCSFFFCTCTVCVELNIRRCTATTGMQCNIMRAA